MAKKATTKQEPSDGIKDRIIGFERINSSEIVDHPMNWRKHTNQQKAAFKGVLDEVGVADALLVYKSERAGGKWCAIDGHMRKNDFPREWPCVTTDLNDAEADLLIQAHDPLGQMAITDRQMLDLLRGQQEFADASVRVMLDGIDTWQPGGKGATGNQKEAADADAADIDSMPEMELQPYEHYDYLLVLARSTSDWNWLCQRLGIELVKSTTDPAHPKIGLGRAIAADKLIAIIQQADIAVQEAEE